MTIDLAISAVRLRDVNVFEKRLYDNIGRFVGIHRVPSDSISDGSSSTILPTFRTEVVYDSFGRMIQRITRLIAGGVASLYTESFTYNKAGELISRTDGRGNVSNNTYDGRGLLVRETLPDADGDGPFGPQFPLVVIHGFDNMGREIRTDRGFGRVTNVEYNSRSWPTKVIEPDPDGTGPATSPTTFIGYNLRGDQTSITDPLSRVTSYVFDNEQRIVGRTDPDPDGTGPLGAPITIWAFNANDWLTSVTDPVGATTSILYDALGRTVTQTDPDPDVAGPLTSPVTQYAYSMRGLESFTDPMSHVTSYVQDNRGRLDSNAVATTNFNYDTANRLDGIAHKQGTTNLNTYAYTYDPLSRLKTVNSTAEGLTTYSYNETSQLTAATNTGAANETYGYDANGNRNTTGYTVAQDNRTTASAAILGFASVPAYTYGYDSEGNITSRSDANGTTTFKYDHRNRLIEAIDSNAPLASLSYRYDAFNRLVARYDYLHYQNWVYDEGINPVYQFDDSTPGINLAHRYLWSNMVDELLADEEVNALESGGNTLWALADHLGSIRDIADNNEGTGATTVVNHRRNNAFGRRTDQSGAVDLIFGYAGKQFDEATGLQLHLNRWYDPNLGKWISQDPIGFDGGDANLYRYVGNRPTMATDPSGLQNKLLFVLRNPFKSD